MSIEHVQRVKVANEDDWMSLPGVEGVGIADCGGRPCIKIFVSRTSDALNAIKPEIDGVKILVEISGSFSALEGD